MASRLTRNASILLWALGPLLSLGAWLAAGETPRMKSPAAAVVLWALALGVVAIVGREAGPQPRWPRREVLALLSVVGLALLLRVWDQHGIPAIISGNEASTGIAARNVLEGLHTNLFNVSWFSFPSLYFALQSIPLRWIGNSVEAVRGSSAIAGAMTVLALYLYTRAAFGKQTAFGAAAFLSAFAFHIHFSRLGLNNIWDGLFASLVSAGLVYGWKSGTRSGYILAGASLGLGQYFYVGLRVFALLIPIWCLATFSGDRSLARRRLLGLGYVPWSALIVALPLGLFYLGHPQEFLAPIARANLFGWWWQIQAIHYGDPAWWILGEQGLNAIGGFGWVPLREFYAGQPLLTGVAFVLFLVGVLACLRRRKDPEYNWLLLWLASSVLVVFLSSNAPSSQRYCLVAPAVATAVAIGCVALGRALGRWTRSRVISPTAWGALLVGLAMLREAGYYFAKYSAEQRFGDYNEETITRAAYYLQDLEPTPEVVFLSSPRLILSQHDTLLFLLPGLKAQDLPWGVTLPEEGALSDNPLFVILLEREADLAEIMRCFPGGSPVRVEGRGGWLLFIAYQGVVP